MNCLYISMMMPYKAASNGGANTLYYYISNMAKQSDMNITLIAKAQNEKEYNTTIDGVSIIPIKNAPMELTHPIRLAKDVNAKLNPFFKYGNTLRLSIYDQILKVVKDLIFKPDVIILEYTQMIFLLEKLKKIYPNARFFASEHDVSFLWYHRKYIMEENRIKKWYWKNRYFYMKQNELKNLSNMDCVFPHNIKDEKLLMNENIDSNKIHTIVPFFQRLNIERNPNNNTIIIYGAMNRPENYESAIWFIENVFTRLKDENVELLIIGGNPIDKLKSYENSRIKVLGFVKTLDEYFSTCTCLVAPLFLGAGIKIKVLEAMYAGVPTLTNDIGIEGIPAVRNQDYYHCDSANDYINIINSLTVDKKNTGKMSESAKNCIRNNFDVDHSFELYLKKIRGDLDNE